MQRLDAIRLPNFPESRFGTCRTNTGKFCLPALGAHVLFRHIKQAKFSLLGIIK